jgi:hypothetical protein
VTTQLVASVVVLSSIESVQLVNPQWTITTAVGTNRVQRTHHCPTSRASPHVGRARESLQTERCARCQPRARARVSATPEFGNRYGAILADWTEGWKGGYIAVSWHGAARGRRVQADVQFGTSFVAQRRPPPPGGLFWVWGGGLGRGRFLGA